MHAHDIPKYHTKSEEFISKVKRLVTYTRIWNRHTEYIKKMRERDWW
jgi:hypothetical protein